MTQQDNRIFAEVKGACSLLDYIEARSSGKTVKSGATTFFNPAPCCSHNDCFNINTKKDTWKCYSCGAPDGLKAGDVFHYAEKVLGMSKAEALKDIAGFAGVHLPERDNPNPEPPRKKSTVEFIADQCLKEPARAVEYLVSRGIDAEVAQRAVLAKAVGFNDYTKPSTAAGEKGHGGPALATIVRTLNPGHVVAVDMRYLDPALNGGIKTQTQGEKQGYGWTSDIKRLHAAETVYFCESAINALSVESCKLGGRWAAFAIRGVGNAGNIPLEWMRGKQAIIVADNDEPGEDGYCAGLRAAWTLHERFTAMDVSCLLLDFSEWGVNDFNDLLKDAGAEEAKRALHRLEQWAIPGMPGHGRDNDLFTQKTGKRRLFLPFHHDAVYWRYRVRPDFTSYVDKVEEDKEEGGATAPRLSMKELAGFRIASISRVTIQGTGATLSGAPDSAPTVKYAVAVQTTRNGPRLVRRVVDDEKLHNVDVWKKFGPVWDQSKFLRLVNILENAAHLGQRHAANFIGVCWRQGELAVNEAHDCFFDDPQYQALYHNLIFPSGPRRNAARVIEAFAATFQENAALLPLVWALGAHLKAVIGYWPHLVMEAEKGSGKSTMLERMGLAIGMRILSSQTLATAYRLVNSVAFSSQPVCWEEFARLSNQNRKLALDLLQETYKHMESTRAMHTMLFSAPVLLAGEDAPVKDIVGKLVRTRLAASKQGAMLPRDLPPFPVREWLDWLTTIEPKQFYTLHENCMETMLKQCRSTDSDNNVRRMVSNYAAVLMAWKLLTEFAGVDLHYNDFMRCLRVEMNDHIADTSAERQPWVWIMETLLSEIAAGHYEGPFKIEGHYSKDKDEEQDCLFVRTSDVMHHLSRTQALRDFWNELPIKSDRVFKRQLAAAGVIFDEAEKTIGNRRYSRMAALSIPALEAYGLSVHRVEQQTVG